MRKRNDRRPLSRHWLNSKLVINTDCTTKRALYKNHKNIMVGTMTRQTGKVRLGRVWLEIADNKRMSHANLSHENYIWGYNSHIHINIPLWGWGTALPLFPVATSCVVCINMATEYNMAQWPVLSILLLSTAIGDLLRGLRCKYLGVCCSWWHWPLGTLIKISFDCSCLLQTYIYDNIDTCIGKRQYWQVDVLQAHS